jgi:hypothetical protein
MTNAARILSIHSFLAAKEEPDDGRIKKTGVQLQCGWREKVE